MCGILGIVGNISPSGHRIYSRALDTIAHRGPNGGAYWSDKYVWLGHRRLAIIDLSTAGIQPMVDPESGLVIVFNGEIYNYLELRSELISKGYKFRTQTDTEVLLKGYVEWGDQVLDKCNGMWAFAIWNPSRREVFLARDRFGVKPLCYSKTGTKLVFASEPKALHAIEPGLMDINVSAILDLIIDSRTNHGEDTFYSQIKSLPPAHCALFNTETGIFTTRRYWDYPSKNYESSDSREAEEEFESLFVDAVKLRLRSDVPVGLTLSGGLDSSSILAASQPLFKEPIRCYTSVYSEFDRGEEMWAAKAASYAGSKLETVEASTKDWLSTLKQILHHLDGPVFSSAVFPLWTIMAKARSDGVPVLLEGQGADEILAGYPQYPAIEVLGQMMSGRLFSSVKDFHTLSKSGSAFWAAAWIARTAFPSAIARITRQRRLKLFRPDAVARWQSRSEIIPAILTHKNHDTLRSALLQDHSTNILPSLLHYGDAVSMAHGIESRLPFMDFRIVEWVFREYPRLLDGAKTKIPVRSFLKSRGYYAIASRPDKKGYPTPIAAWFHTIGFAHLDEALRDPSRKIWSFMDPSHVARLAYVARNGSQLGLFHLYKVLVTDLWLGTLQGRSTMRS